MVKINGYENEDLAKEINYLLFFGTTIHFNINLKL